MAKMKGEAMDKIKEIVNDVFRERFNHVTHGTPLFHEIDAARMDIIARIEKMADDTAKATKKQTTTTTA